MQLIRILEQHRIPWTDIDIDAVAREVSTKYGRFPQDNIKGMIAEQYVWQWLDNVPGLEHREDFTNANMSLRKVSTGYRVYPDGSHCALVEYDYWFRLYGQEVGLEVKSGHIKNDFLIRTAMNAGRLLTGNRFHYIICKQENKASQASARILLEHPDVKFLDMGINDNQFSELTNRVKKQLKNSYVLA